MTLQQLAEQGSAEAARLIARLEAIAERAYLLAMEMDFRFLFDPNRKLFAIGFQQASHSLDGSYYDLLASEARLASFIAVAKNDAPVEHWFHLGRSLTYAAGAPALVSWSGSMFEYLMPALVMRAFPHTLLAQTADGALARQRAYGARAGRAVGGERERLQRPRPARDLSVPPLRRAGPRPQARPRPRTGGGALRLAARRHARSPGGARQPRGARTTRRRSGPTASAMRSTTPAPTPDQRFAVVHTYMAHHLGMGLVALTNVLGGHLWQRRFHADPLVRSAELLLHERIPRRLVLHKPQDDRADTALPETEPELPAVRQIDTPDTTHPHVALLGHQPYTIMVTHCGGGYSRYESLAVTRWRSDGSRDATGQFCYLKDLGSGRVWSAGHQPVCAPADWQHAYLATDRVTFDRADGDIETRTEIVVVPEDAAEVRRVTVTNNGTEPAELELTSYGELVLAPPDADRAHPAFGNLFVETEWHAWCGAITATRRPRSSEEQPIWCVHVAATGPELVGAVTCETDRARFLGRGRSSRDPVALEQDGPLSMTTGAVLDPIFALRTRVTLAAGAIGVGGLHHLRRDQPGSGFRARRPLPRPAFGPAGPRPRLDLQPGGAPRARSHPHAGGGVPGARRPALPRQPDPAARRRRSCSGPPGRSRSSGPPGSRATGPSCSPPSASADGLPTLRQLLAAHRYWRRHGMTVDLVILNTHPPDYLQDLADRITSAVYALGDSGSVDRSGGVFLRRRDLLTAGAAPDAPSDGAGPHPLRRPAPRPDPGQRPA